MLGEGTRSPLAAAQPRKRADIQGLRAIAVVLVVAFHAGVPSMDGFVGVDLFFAISGFVITTSLLRELTSTGRLSLPGFYRRRVKRLLPALAVLLVVVALVGSLASPIGAAHAGAVTGIWSSIFGANFYLLTLGTGYFDVATNLNPLLHTWTLAVEEQFYLLFPLILLAAWRLGRRRSEPVARATAFLAIGGISVVSFHLMTSGAGGGVVAGFPGPQFAFYASPARAWEFGAGALLALLAPSIRRLPLLLGTALGAVGVGLVAVGTAPAVGQSGLRPNAALLTVCGAVALIAAGAAPSNLVSRALARRPAVWIGNLSYSWYLWHWPLIVFARSLWPGREAAVIGAVAISLLVAWASYRYVENPIRANRRVRGRLAVALAAACMAVPIAGFGGVLATDSALAQTQTLKSWSRVERLHADVRNGCNDPTPLGQRKGWNCTWHVPRPHGKIVLVGDSNAGQFTEPFVSAARSTGYDATVATLSSCPFVDLYVDEGTGTFQNLCNRFVTASLASILRSRPSLVIMAARSDGYIENADVSLRRPGERKATRDPVAKAALWRSGLDAVLIPLSRAGIPAIVVHPVPDLPTDSQASAVLRILLRSAPEVVSRRAVDRRRRRSVVAENLAVAKAPPASSLDFEAEVCSPTQCSSTSHGAFLYRDSTHLSIDGALRFTGRFRAAIVAHARRDDGLR